MSRFRLDTPVSKRECVFLPYANTTKPAHSSSFYKHYMSITHADTHTHTLLSLLLNHTHRNFGPKAARSKVNDCGNAEVP